MSRTMMRIKPPNTALKPTGPDLRGEVSFDQARG
jgi:hypothetical protein